MPTNLPVPPPADPLLPPQQPVPKPDIVPPDDPNHDRADREPNIDPPPTDPGVDDPVPDRERRLVSGPAWLAVPERHRLQTHEEHP